MVTDDPSRTSGQLSNHRWFLDLQDDGTGERCSSHPVEGLDAANATDALESDELLFRFPIVPDGQPLHPENEMEALFRSFLSSMLDVVELFDGDGQRVDVASFLFHNEMSDKEPHLKPVRDTRSDISVTTSVSNKVEADLRGGQEGNDEFYDPLVLVRTEPRVQFIQRAFQALNRVARAETSDGKVAAFGLRDLDQWVRPSQGDPYEVIASLSRNCNARCIFCYVHGNPKDASIRLNSFSVEKSRHEADVRLQYYAEGKTLLPPTYDLEEILVHSGSLDVLESLRTVSPNDLISLTTNGYTLDDSTVERLVALDPVELTVSVNASTPAARQRVMGGRAELGINGVRRLHERGLRVTATLVAWPEVPIDELIQTIELVDELNVRIIDVILGGYTRLFPNPPVFDPQHYWASTVRELTPLRRRLQHPLIIQPGMFTQSLLHPDDLNGAHVAGISPMSPASEAGLAIGDLIEQVNGVPVMSRPHCLSLLGTARDDERAICVLDVRREGGSPMTIELGHEAASEDYLYGPPVNDRFGVFLEASGITVSAMRHLFRMINHADADHVVVVTSHVVRPHFEAMLRAWSFLCRAQPTRIESLVPENRYYGGNIVLGDLFTVEDIVSSIKDYIDREGKPDLVVVPSASFNYGGWLRDIRGTPFRHLQRSLDVRCELLISDNFE